MRASNFPSIRRSSSLPRQGPKAGFVKNIIGYESFTTFDAARASRRQHQLASMDDQGLRETRRRLVQSLHEIAFIFAKYGLRKPKVPLLPMVAPAPTVVPTVAAVDKDASASTSHKEIKLDEISKQQAHSLDNEKIDRGNEKNGIASAAVQEGLTSEALLWNALRRKDVKTTITLFNSAIGEGQSLSRRILARLFYAIVQSDCITAYQALLLYRNEGRLTNAEMKMYLRLCSSVSSLDPNNHNRRKATQFVRKLVADLHSMEWEEKQEILPKMIASLATQRMVKIGLHADGLYRYMAENEFQMTMGWLRQLLSLSKYNRQEDLPFHDILARLAEGEGHPHPLSVIQAIHNMFPFTNPSTVCPALKAVFQLQQTIESVDPNRIRNFQMLQLDLDCLEAISTGAAHSGSSEQISLVWEILEQCNYRPTETIYENTVIALAFSARDLEAAFGAINAMKQEGYIVSRALLRSFALALRYGQ